MARAFHPNSRSEGSAASALHAYRAHSLETASPSRLILLALETALRACRNGRRGLLHRTLSEMLGALDLRHEPAQGLLRLYEYLIFLVREGRLDEVEETLVELHTTWSQALRAQ